MTEKLKEVIIEEVSKLPKEAQEVISNFEWTKLTEEIGKKYLLDESEINDLQVETLLVLIGFTEPELFSENIENNIGTTKKDSESINIEINKTIFNPVVRKIEESIKNKTKDGNHKWDQNLDFILSGGDYSTLVNQRRTEEAPEKFEPIIDKSKIDAIKNKLVI